MILAELTRKFMFKFELARRKRNITETFTFVYMCTLYTEVKIFFSIELHILFRCGKFIHVQIHVFCLG